MENGSDTGVPDLATVLRELAAFVPAPVPQSSGQISQSPGLNNFQQTIDPRPAPQHRQQFTASNDRPRTPPIDPATITEWASGLRCVSKIAAQNPEFASSIRRMILDQAQHEKLWWNGRQDLIRKQSARTDGSRKLNDVLKSLGGSVTSEPVSNTLENNQTELDTYDMKVYKAQVEMFNAMSGELKRLGVPFFGVKPELTQKSSDASDDTTSAVTPGSKIQEGELLKLQRRMLTYLEDMYKP